jgi:predicted DCC family thiol-disulfide oxidoreductase YuxK
MKQQHAKAKTILFYDGECALCNFWVQFCIERDRKKILFYAPLQGATAMSLLAPEFRQEAMSVVLWKNSQSQIKSKAIISALKTIRYSPDIVLLLSIAPTQFLDFIYDIVAKNRYRWFGKMEVCRLPPEEHRTQLLG